MLIELSAETVAFLFAIGIFAGCVDAVAGGGGLITLPALIAAGLPPQAALATNKLQSTAGSMMSSAYFVRQKIVNLGEYKYAVALTLLGSWCGSRSVNLLPSEVLSTTIPFMLIAVASFMAFSPKLGVADKAGAMPKKLFLVSVPFALGFYDGIFGPGTGAFLSLLFVWGMGYNLIKATGHAKLLNFASNISALSHFALAGGVYWQVGGVMFLGQLIGGHLGARLAVKKGARLIKPVAVGACLLLAVKLILDHF